MKKIAVIIGVFSLFFIGCDDVLSIVTVNEDGEKIFHNYVSLVGYTVYDAAMSLRNWQDIEQLDDDDFSSENLLFTIVSESENIIVLGSDKYAMEIKFFDGGYRYTVFISAAGLLESY